MQDLTKYPKVDGQEEINKVEYEENIANGDRIFKVKKCRQKSFNFLWRSIDKETIRDRISKYLSAKYACTFLLMKE